MREFEKGSKKFVEVDGLEIPYDGVVKIYVDSATGNWVVSTPFEALTMFDLLSDAVDHFVELLAKQYDKGLPPELVADRLVDELPSVPRSTIEWN